MQRLKNIFHWVGLFITGAAIFVIILTASFWDTVMLGRTEDEQIEEVES